METRQEDFVFEANLGYKVKPCLEKLRNRVFLFLKITFLGSVFIGILVSVVIVIETTFAENFICSYVSSTHIHNLYL